VLDMATRALLLGRPLERAFSPITSPVKLANGQRPWGALQDALDTLGRARRDDPGLPAYPMLKQEEVARLRAAARSVDMDRLPSPPAPGA
jgi:hypothetical protein